MQCQTCFLVYVAPAFLPSQSDELNEYQLHQNSFDDEGYVAFLNRIVAPLTAHIQPGAHGLDFGCGPSPVLASLLKSAGMTMRVFDPFFANHASSLQQQYDFVTCTEAIEHFHAPGKEFSLLVSLLKPKGWLGIMTKRVISRERFATWHYKNDPTHVCFFSDATFHYLANVYHLSVDFISSDIVLMQK